MNLCDFLMGMNLSGGSGGGGDPETKAIVDNAVENHGIGTVYTETILAPVTVAPEDWDVNNKYTLTGVALDLVLGKTYLVAVNGTTYNVAAVDADGEIALPLMDLGIAVIAGSEGPPTTDPYIFAFRGAPAESMTFSIAQETINKIDSKFIDPWDVVVFFDLDNQNGTLLKGNAAALFEKILSSEVNVSTLAIGQVADTNVQDRWHYVTLNTSYMTDPYSGSLWMETSSSDFQVPYMTWGWDLDTNEIYPD